MSPFVRDQAFQRVMASRKGGAYVSDALSEQLSQADCAMLAHLFSVGQFADAGLLIEKLVRDYAADAIADRADDIAREIEQDGEEDRKYDAARQAQMDRAA